LVKLLINKVLPVQPVSLIRIDVFVVTAKILFDSVLIDNEIPSMELPTCILAELFDSKDKKLQKFW